MIAFFLRGKGHALDRQVIAFGAAACKGDLCRAAIQNLGYLFTGTIDSLHGVTTKSINAAGIAILCRQIRYHGIQHTLIKCGGGGMVKIDGTLGHNVLFLLSGKSLVRLWFDLKGRNCCAPTLYHRND